MVSMITFESEAIVDIFKILVHL